MMIFILSKVGLSPCLLSLTLDRPTAAIETLAKQTFGKYENKNLKVKNNNRQSVQILLRK